MPKRIIVIIIVVLAVLVDVLFGPWLRGKLAVLPGLRNWPVLTSQSSIVINRREVVRDGSIPSFGQAASSLKSQLSTLAIAENGQTAVVGTLINVTNDGLFLTTGVNMQSPLDHYFIVLYDSRIVPVQSVVTDPATGLVFLQAAVNDVPVAPFGNSGDLGVGDPLAMLNTTLTGGSLRLAESYVMSSQADVSRQGFDADHPSRSFALPAYGPWPLGSVVGSLRTEVSGLFLNGAVISSDVIKGAVTNYLSNNHKLARPHFGFAYRIISNTESALTKANAGALVVNVAAGSPATTAGLKVGDIITKLNDQQVDESHGLEEFLANIKPQDSVRLVIVRGGQSLNLTLIPDILK